ncbi:MAG: hypothetical protein IVW57_15490, partial [Ktedonobacterales bacterium]|nr:hypothetical protein [Ktedonobacterales bacterium]
HRTVTAYFDGRALKTNIYLADTVTAGQHMHGPAILAGTDSTLLLPPGFTAHIDRYGNMRVPIAS